MVMGWVSGLSLANHLAWPILSLTQGPFWWHVHLSAKMDSSSKDSGRLAGRMMGWCLLPPSGPSWILPVSFGDSTVSLIGTSCCETTRASGYHPAWPRWAVSVSGSLAMGWCGPWTDRKGLAVGKPRRGDARMGDWWGPKHSGYFEWLYWGPC